MALTDKNIVITPNTGQSNDPQIVFSGADSSTSPQNITVKVYPTNNGTISFEGSSGQLFSVTNSLSGTIFSVNDVSGIPSISVLDTGVVALAQYAGNVGINTAAPSYPLHVAGTAYFPGTSSTAGATLQNATEIVNVVSAAPGSTVFYYINSGNVQYYTSNTAINWTLNITFSSGTTLNSALAIGQSVTLSLIVTNGGSAYYPILHQIDGTAVTPKWQGGVTPSSGDASALDVYVYTIIKTASATYTVLASQTKFA